jgi:plasmid stabilization system protein ParE
MPSVKFSDFANQDLLRLFDFLAQYDRHIATRAIKAILDVVDVLEHAPYRGSPLQDRPDTRKLVVDYGATGHLVFHKYDPKTDVVQVARVLHQKEGYSVTTIGLDSAIPPLPMPLLNTPNYSHAAARKRTSTHC